MSEWISVDDSLPLCDDYASGKYYECVIVLVTDGEKVRQQTFSRGMIEGEPESAWAEFGDYGSFHPSEITHWMPLPPPPDQDK